MNEAKIGLFLSPLNFGTQLSLIISCISVMIKFSNWFYVIYRMGKGPSIKDVCKFLPIFYPPPRCPNFQTPGRPH